MSTARFVRLCLELKLISKVFHVDFMDAYPYEGLGVGVGVVGVEEDYYYCFTLRRSALASINACEIISLGDHLHCFCLLHVSVRSLLTI